MLSSELTVALDATVTGGSRVSDPRYLRYDGESNPQLAETNGNKPLEYLTRGAGEDGMPRQILRMGGCGSHRRPVGVKEPLIAGEVCLVETNGGHWPPGVVLYRLLEMGMLLEVYIPCTWSCIRQNQRLQWRDQTWRRTWQIQGHWTSTCRR
jgi:hypothetical protein